MVTIAFLLGFVSFLGLLAVLYKSVAYQVEMATELTTLKIRMTEYARSAACSLLVPSTRRPMSSSSPVGSPSSMRRTVTQRRSWGAISVTITTS